MKISKLPKWKLKNLILSGLFISIGLLMPIGFHAFGGIGPKLLPMQFGVLLAGFFLCPKYAIFVGLITPILSGVLTGMPPFFPNMPCLSIEFASYAFFLSILRTKSKYLRLTAALILGKIVLFCFALLNYQLMVFAIKQLSNGLIGMTWQILLVPIVVKGIENGGFYVRRSNGKAL